MPKNLDVLGNSRDAVTRFPHLLSGLLALRFCSDINRQVFENEVRTEEGNSQFHITQIALFTKTCKNIPF